MNRGLAGAPSRNPGGRILCTEEEFFRLTAVIEENTGLTFSPEKQRELSIKLGKLSPIEGVHSAEDLIREASRSAAVLQKIINVITVGESYFFRNRPHFNALKETIIPELVEMAETRGSLNIWCAGCANGEEPYSIAILLKDHFPQLAGWEVSIVATDINTDYLASAEEGVFRNWSFRGVAPDIIRRHFELLDDGSFRISRNIAKQVSFQHFNLARVLEGHRPVQDPVDLLLCRNVLIYFPYKTSDDIIRQFRDTLRPGGFLLVGHSEAFPSLGNFEPIYSSATYYYRRHLDDAAFRLTMPAAATAAIPGIAVRSTYMPLRPSSIAAPFPVSSMPRYSFSSIPEPVDELSVARELANGGNSEEALALLDDLAVGRGRLDHRVHFLKAIVVDHKGQARQATDSLKRAIFLNKNFVVGHYYLGVISQREGDRAAALRHFKNVIRLLDKLPPSQPLEEAEGLSAKWLREMVGGQFEELALDLMKAGD